MVTFKILSYIAATIYFIIILRWDIKTDLKKDTDNVAHTEESIVRVFLLLPTYLLLLWPKLYHTHIWSWESLAPMFITAALMFSVWWELFDGFYNLGRKQKWRFNGTVDENDSVLDRFLYNIGDTWEAVLKLGLITLSLLAFLLI